MLLKHHVVKASLRRTVEIESEFDLSEVDSDRDQPAEPRKDPDPEEDTLFTKTLYDGAKTNGI